MLMSRNSLLFPQLAIALLLIFGQLPLKAQTVAPATDDRPTQAADAAAEVTGKSESSESTTADQKDIADHKDKLKGRYVRVKRDKDGEPLAMETAVIRFHPAAKKAEPVIVDLVGAVHVGEKSYYDELNRRFKKYDVVLYELVAPEGTRVPREGRPASAHPVSAVQNGMQSMLELAHQLDCVDYTRDNFVHADMSPEEFAKSMKDRGESFMQMFFRMMGHGIAEQSRDPQRSQDRQLLAAMFAKDRALRLKRIMAEQFESLEDQTGVFEGPEGSTVITERNGKAFERLREQLDAGKKKIAVFYGAGHLPDMEERLSRDFGMQRVRVQWIPAWSLTSPEKP
ncbi:MAG: hypothetical protein KDA38_06870 [Planctomycetales bacterium]|nr:hypothetical protein [Planctomycetales bacterium]